jgi:hypothetical protein
MSMAAAIRSIGTAIQTKGFMALTSLTGVETMVRRALGQK